MGRRADPVVGRKRYPPPDSCIAMLTTTTHGALLLGAAVLVVAVAVGDGTVPLSRRTVLAAGPWTVAAAGVVVAARSGAYAGATTPVTTPSLLLAVGVLALGSWILLVRVAVVRGMPFRERYLAAAGTGAVVVVFGGLLGHVEDVTATRFVWLAIVPVAAVLLAGLGYFALGLVYTDAVVAFRLAGLFALAAVVFDGVAAAAAAESLGMPETGLTAAILRVPLDAGGLDPSAWLLVPLSLLLGIAIVAACTAVWRRRPSLGTGGVLVASVAALASATVVLSSAVLLG